jgi:hypothetical protein
MAYDGGFSQPVWGPEISTVGAYSREGYTSRTFDRPFVPFSTQEFSLQVDEDVQLAINHLSSLITGGEHYWKAHDDLLSKYMTKFTKDLHFDEMSNKMVKELLWYGNSVWKPRLGIQFVRNHHDLMHIPISSFIRIWWDRQRIPYKYEFRGPEYQGYHNPEDIIHFTWNPINASAFGTGFGVSTTSIKQFQQITPAGPVDCQLPSLLDRKYSQQLTMHITERRYIPHNVYVALDSTESERTTLNSQLVDLVPGQDFVSGTQLEVHELGSSQRAFDPTLFADLVQGPIMKALNTYRGKQSEAGGPTYSNAKTAALLDEIGLSAFPITFKQQLEEFIFRSWYESNPFYSAYYGGGLVSIPWDDCEFEFNFGRIQKKDVPPEVMINMINAAWQTGAVRDPTELRKLFEDAGLPLRKEFSDMMYNEYNNTGMFPNDFGNQQPQYGQMEASIGGPMRGDIGGGEMPRWSTIQGDQARRPMDNPRYGLMYTPRFDPHFHSQPSDPRLNFDQWDGKAMHHSIGKTRETDDDLRNQQIRTLKAKEKAYDKLADNLDDNARR